MRVPTDTHFLYSVTHGKMHKKQRRPRVASMEGCKYLCVDFILLYTDVDNLYYR